MLKMLNQKLKELSRELKKWLTFLNYKATLSKIKVMKNHYKLLITLKLYSMIQQLKFSRSKLKSYHYKPKNPHRAVMFHVESEIQAQNEEIRRLEGKH